MKTPDEIIKMFSNKIKGKLFFLFFLENLINDELDEGPLDNYECKVCHIKGNRKTSGRLLNFDIDCWVHANCALWSDNVEELMNGELSKFNMTF